MLIKLRYTPESKSLELGWKSLSLMLLFLSILWTSELTETSLIKKSRRNLVAWKQTFYSINKVHKTTVHFNFKEWDSRIHYRKKVYKPLCNWKPVSWTANCSKVRPWGWEGDQNSSCWWRNVLAIQNKKLLLLMSDFLE